jgi:hypothetical protein
MQMNTVRVGSGKVDTMRQKIQDFLYYSILSGERVNATDFGNCTQECGKGAFM